VPEAGVRNDERVTNRAIIDRYGEFSLEDVRVPTLLPHAEDDLLASFEDAEGAADRIPDAELRAYEDGGHLLFDRGDDVERTLSAFLEREIDTAAGSGISVSG
jgi:pimeloyl-ACP methyl ester carboxylesterase